MRQQFFLMREDDLARTEIRGLARLSRRKGLDTAIAGNRLTKNESTAFQFIDDRDKARPLYSEFSREVTLRATMLSLGTSIILLSLVTVVTHTAVMSS